MGLWLLLVCAGSAQSVVDPGVLGDFVKRFDAQPGERPLECSVTPIQPSLNFSFRFQSGYVVRIPMRQYFGSGHAWLIAVRVTPEGGGGQPVYFAYKVTLPDVPLNNVETEQGGGYLLGAGKYRVRWLLLDNDGRVCRKEWRLEAALKRGERQAKVAAPPYSIQAFSLGSGAADGALRDDRSPFRVTILLHAAPLSPFRNRLRASDQVLLVGSLSALLERLPARSVRIVVFNLAQQRELYRRDGFTPAALDEVTRAIGSLELNVVNYHVLEHPKGHMDLLSDIVNKELRSDEPSDAVIFLGPASRFSDKPAADAWDRPPGSSAPLFLYLQYRPVFRGALTDPQRLGRLQQSNVPETLGLTVAALKGKTYRIYTPADFAKAIAQLERLVPPPAGVR